MVPGGTTVKSRRPAKSILVNIYVARITTEVEKWGERMMARDPSLESPSILLETSACVSRHRVPHTQRYVLRESVPNKIQPAVMRFRVADSGTLPSCKVLRSSSNQEGCALRAFGADVV